MIEEVFNEKCRFKICSFSGEKALRNPVMWGYYANGFKGLAFEIDVSQDVLKKMKYVPKTQTIGMQDIKNVKRTAKRILSTKLSRWSHEDEYRLLTEKYDSFQEVGKITAVYFGDPYGDTDNHRSIYNVNPDLGKYAKIREEVVNLVKGKGIPCFSVTIQNKCVIKGTQL